MCVWQSTRPGVTSRPFAFSGRASRWRCDSSAPLPISSTRPSWNTIAPFGKRRTLLPSASGVTTSDVLCRITYAVRPATVLPLNSRPTVTTSPPARSRRDPGQLHAGLLRVRDRFRIAGVGVTHDAAPRIVREHALEPRVGVRAAVGHDDQPRVDRVADADAAAVVHADPRRAGRAVEERVQDRPVGDRVAAVLHALRLAIRRR